MDGITHSASRALARSVAALAAPPGGSGAARGIVTKVEEGGTLWVRLSGASADMPCTRSFAAAKAGDAVSVAIEGGRATVVGNYTAPATDDAAAIAAAGTASEAAAEARTANALAKAAEADAGRAKAAAEAAEESAEVASGYAERAQGSAEQASKDAQDAVADALAAQMAADRAGDAATAAQAGLSRLQDVVGTVNWLAQHSKETEDTTAQAGKDYYTKDPITGALTSADVAAGDDIEGLGLWELAESVQKYVASYLALVDGVLTLSSGGTARVELSADAMRFVAGDGNTVASIEVLEDGRSVMRITRSVVLEDMSLGDWNLSSRVNGNLSFKWVG